MILYLGPGLAGGVIAAIISTILALIILIISIFWYPLKRVYLLLKNLFSKKK
jgi:hypothetical protein